jgi:hypothetical protein
MTAWLCVYTLLETGKALPAFSWMRQASCMPTWQHQIQRIQHVGTLDRAPAFVGLAKAVTLKDTSITRPPTQLLHPWVPNGQLRLLRS